MSDQPAISVRVAQEQRDNWIRTRERLPEKAEWVLIVFKNFSDQLTVSMAFFDPGEEPQFYHGDDYLTAEEVTHWQPLPDPPKEK